MYSDEAKTEVLSKELARSCERCASSGNSKVEAHFYPLGAGRDTRRCHPNHALKCW